MSKHRYTFVELSVHFCRNIGTSKQRYVETSVLSRLVTDADAGFVAEELFVAEVVGRSTVAAVAVVGMAEVALSVVVVAVVVAVVAVAVCRDLRSSGAGCGMSYLCR